MQLGSYSGTKTERRVGVPRYPYLASPYPSPRLAKCIDMPAPEEDARRRDDALELVALHARCAAQTLGRLASCSAVLSSATRRSSLAALYLAGNREPKAFFEDALGEAGGRYAQLRRLEVAFCDRLTDAHLALLPTGLTALALDACRSLGDGGVEALVRACGASLVSLRLYAAVRLTDSSARHLARCGRLQSLSLSGCTGIGSEGMLSVASRLRRLTELDLTRMPLLDDIAAAAIMQGNPRLVSVTLYANGQLSEAPILSLARAARASLTQLDFTGLNDLADAPLLALGAVASALHSLSISWCLGVTDVGVAAIAAGCPLEVLSLHGIRGLTAAALDALVAHRAASLVALDVRGCIGMGCPQPASLRARLPRVHTFVIHKG